MLRKILGHMFGIFGIIWALYHLILIEIRGSVLIYEDNPYILWTEIVIVSGIVILLIYNFIEGLHRDRD